MSARNTHSPQATDGRGLHERLREELRDFAIIAGYLYVCLVLLLVYKTVILESTGEMEVLPFGIAAVKALILGKFALLGRAARLGEGCESDTVLRRIVRKSLAFVIFLVGLSLVEEVVVGWWHGETVAATIAAFGGSPALQVVADCAVLLLVVIPFIALVQIAAALGPGVLPGVLRKSGHSHK